MTEPVNIRQIIEAELSNQLSQLFEGSLSRIMQHVKNAKEKGFAILTSWRQSNEKAANIANFQALKGKVREKGLGFIQLRGHWQECQDPEVKYDECPPDQMADSIEPSLMVIGLDLKSAMALGEAYQQDAVVYAGPETGGMVQLHFKDGSTMDIGTFSPMAIGQAFSEYRSKKSGDMSKVARFFKFEGHSYPAQTHLEKLVEAQMLKNIEKLMEGLAVTKKK